MSEATTIVIDLTDHRDARSIEDEQYFVHQDALKRLRQLLPPLIEDAAKPVDKRHGCEAAGNVEREVSNRRHDTIAVLGGRGSGKTTFLLSVLCALEGGKLDLVPDGHKVRSLGILDPTLVGTKECILLTIISRIKALVDAVNHRCDPLDRDPSDREKWEKALARLAGGLAVLDELGTNPLKDDGWEDPSYVVETGLANVTNSRLLERRFHEFLDASLTLLKASAFVIGIDDIDTAFDRGWPVLETLRRYLTSPKLIVLLAGDQELFSALVRKKQWSNLGNLPHRYEPDKTEYYGDLVDRLEDQYLMKLIKPENRIFLVPIYQYYERIGDAMQVKIAQQKTNDHVENNTKPIGEYISAFISSVLFVRRPKDLDKFIRIFLGEPIRSVVQILRVCEGYNEAKDRETSDFAKKGKQDAVAPETEAIDQLLHVLNGPLWKLGLQSHRVRGMGPHDIGPLIALRLVELDLLDPGYRMWPDFADSMTNLGFIALGAKLATIAAHRPSAAIEYMLKVGLTREIQVTGPSEPRIRHRFMLRYLHYADINNTETALGVARRASAFLRTEGDGRVYQNTTKLGTVALYGDRRPPNPIHLMYGVDVDNASILRKEDCPEQMRFLFDRSILTVLASDPAWSLRGRDYELGLFFNTLNSLEDSILDPEISGLASLPMQLVIDAEGNATPVMSVFSLIALVGHILECDNEEEIRSQLRGSAQLRSYPVPPTSDEHRRSAPAVDSTSEVQKEQRVWWSDPAPQQAHKFDKLPEALWRWAKHWKDKNSGGLPMYAFARTWTRFYYTLARCDAAFRSAAAAAAYALENLPPTELSIVQEQSRFVHAGEALHRFLIAFFNACLVESDIFGENSLEVNLRNADADDEIFLKNLLILINSKQGDNCEFFKLIWTCPLWSYYMDTCSDVYIYYREMTKELGFAVDTEFSYAVEAVKAPNLYPLFNTLLIHRPEHPSVSPQSNEDQPEA